MPYSNNIIDALKKVSIYDFDSLKDNANSSIFGKIKLEDNGNNIPIALSNILNNPEKKREFFNYIRCLIPFIEDIEVERILDKHLQIKYKEKYSTDQYIPASLMSNGTITLIAMIIGLYFENNSIIIFDEPATRIHPYLIARLIEMMKEVSLTKQIFITTHNPEIVKYAGIENVFSIIRNKEGGSSIGHLDANNDIKQFIANEIGLEELFVQNILSK